MSNGQTSGQASGQASPSALAGLFDTLFGDGASERLGSLFVKPNKDGEDQTRFSTYLPYRAWDHERNLAVLAEGVGFCLEVNPQSGADASMAEGLLGLFYGWQPGTAVQIHLFGTPHIQRRLASYAALRAEDENQEQLSIEAGRPVRNTNLYRVMARRRYAHLLKGAYHSITDGSVYMLREFRLVISVTAPCRIEQHAKIQDLLNQRQAVMTALSNSGYPCREWGARDLLNWCADLLNPQRLYEEPPPIPHDEGRLLKDQIIDHDTRQVETERGITFSKTGKPNVEMRVFGVKGYPERFSLWRMGALVGDLMQGALQYPCPFVITMGAYVLDPADTGAWVTANQARATQNANSKAAPLLPDAAEKKRDWDRAKEIMENRGNLLKLYHTLILFPLAEHASRAEASAESVWRDQGFQLCNMTYVARACLLSSLPLTLDKVRQRALEKFKIPTTKSFDNAVSVAPMLGEWMGSQTPVLMFAGRRGQIAGFDFYDNPEGNYNVAIVGTSGSGKSVMMNEIALAYLGTGAKVFMLDLGKSFEKLCVKADGQFVEMYAGSGININPFTHVVEIGDDLAMLQAVIAKMAAPFAELDPYQYQAIADAITRAWGEHNRETTITHLVKIFRTGRLMPDAPVDRRLTDLATMLSPYATGGLYAEFFDGPSTIDFSSNLVVIEVESLKRSPSLHRVALMILMFRITSEMYFDRATRKLLMIDELQQQLGGDDDPTMTRIIEEAARRARKYGGSLLTATQMVEDYYQSDSLQTAFALSDCLMIMRQRKESIEMLARDGKLHLDPYRKRMLQSLRKTNRYSEVYIHSPMGEGVLRLVVDPFALLVYSNRHEDNAPIDERRARGMSVDEAIEDLLRERGIKVAT